MDHRSDDALWEAVRSGGPDAPDAFGELFDRYADVVYRYAMVRLRRAEWAEDVVSTVFSEAWRQRAHVDLHEGTLRPWLLGVARNQANRLWSQQSRREQRERRSVVPDEADHAAGVAEHLDAEADLGVVLDAIGALPDGPRETLVLHVWGELSHEQIAAELGISIGTVKSRLSRARSRLATALNRRSGTLGASPEVVAMFDDEAAGGEA
jgi:RNA polymerase sigma-70 factor (ECF subfamily)